MDPELSVEIDKRIDNKIEIARQKAFKRLGHFCWLLGIAGSVLAYVGAKDLISKGVKEELSKTAALKALEDIQSIQQSARTSKEDIEKNQLQCSKLLDRIRDRNARMDRVTPVSGVEVLISTEQQNATVLIPNEVPMGATSVLVYCKAHSGRSAANTISSVQVSSGDGPDDFVYNLHYVQSTENAVAFNSDYFWLPINKARTLDLRFSSAISSSSFMIATAQVVGYR